MPSSTSVQSSTNSTRCFFCPKNFSSDAARSQHLAATPQCAAKQRAATLVAQDKQRGEHDQAPVDRGAEAQRGPSDELEDPAPARKRRKVTMETVSEDAPQPIPATRERLRSPSTEPTLPRPNDNPDPNPSGRPPSPQPGLHTYATRPLREYKGLFVEDFLDPSAGAPISDELAPTHDADMYMRSCGHMADPEHFETAELLMTTGLTNEAKDQHLKSGKYRGKTPWPNAHTMLADVDNLRHGPGFELHEIAVSDGIGIRMQFLIVRNVIQVISEIFANTALKDFMTYAPERLWTNAGKTERLFGNMSTSNWWWNEQMKLMLRGLVNVTIVPLIIATDQTVLSLMCGGQKAYPVYLTLGNIDKGMRRKPSKRCSVLLGYLPVEAFEDIRDDKERRRMKADLVHRAMEKMLEPLKTAANEGVEMWCPDGRKRRVYPRIAAYVADWPEQNLQCCTSEGSCPICKTEWAGRGDLDQTADLREREETLGAIRAYFVHKDVRDLNPLSLKPVWPWWGDIPDVNLSTCITPDLLHQIYHGIFKSHLVRWLRFLIGKKNLDDRYAAMTTAEGMRHFSKGISGVKQWTGRESKQMISQILPAVIGDLSPELARMVRSLVDFIYRAHASSLSDRDLKEMETDLADFHELKDLLIAKGFYESSARFDGIPKLHMLSHYVHTIRELGSPDGYNTEAPEHLHIEYAKEPWRASNKVRPLPQMIKYVQRQEAIRIHRAYMDEHLGLGGKNGGGDENDNTEGDTVEIGVEVGVGIEGDHERDGESGGEASGALAAGVSGVGEGGNMVDGMELDARPDAITYPNPRRHMAKHPTKRNLPLTDVICDYGAPNLTDAITHFLENHLRVPSENVMLSHHQRVDVWHRLYLYHQPLPFAPFDPPRRDVIRASAPVRGPHRVTKEGVWDVALYYEKPYRLRSSRNNEQKHGILRYRAGRVRAFFTLPGHLQKHYAGQLAYLELFAPFEANVSPFTRMHSTKPDLDSSQNRRTLVIPVTDIVLACHLAPKFHLLDKGVHLSAHTDLFALSKYFWLNHYYNHHFFQLVQNWRRPRPRLRERLLALVRQSWITYSGGTSCASAL